MYPKNNKLTERKTGKGKVMDNNVKDNIDTGDGSTAAAVEEKMFTQEQVNEIIRKRLKEKKDAEINSQELDARAAELDARESRLKCKEYLMEKGYKADLLDILDTSDATEFEKKADAVSQMYGSEEADVAPLANLDGCYGSVSAFPDTTHIPKGYWPTDPR